MEKDVPLEPLPVEVAIGLGDYALHSVVHPFRRPAA